jgi:hypothetical protein
MEGDARTRASSFAEVPALWLLLGTWRVGLEDPRIADHSQISAFIRFSPSHFINNSTNAKRLTKHWNTAVLHLCSSIPLTPVPLLLPAIVFFFQSGRTHNWCQHPLQDRRDPVSNLRPPFHNTIIGRKERKLHEA